MSESRVESAAAHSRFGVWCGVLLVAGAAGLLFQTPKSARASETAPAGEPLRFGTADRVLVDSIRTALEPLIAAGAEDGSSLRIDLDEVMGALDPEARRFLDSIQGDVRPGPADGVEFVRLVGQSVRGAQGQTTLPVQLLPAVVHEAYQAMSAAMEAELGKRLLVGSGYRSHGYQLFVFASYLSAADYSITETLRHVSLPSEHSQPERQGRPPVHRSPGLPGVAGVSLARSERRALRVRAPAPGGVGHVAVALALGALSERRESALAWPGGRPQPSSHPSGRPACQKDPCAC
jgi:hypothetical protein